MIDETGKKVWEETFDLWGKPHDRLETRVVGGAILTNVKPREANKNQEISQPFRFPGQYHDEETGLYYNRYRYYMPGEGMYTQRDPIGLAGGNPTVYGYVFDTLQEVDPFGLDTTNYRINIVNGRKIYQPVKDIFTPGIPTFVDKSVNPSIKKMINNGLTNLDPVFSNAEAKHANVKS